MFNILLYDSAYIGTLHNQVFYLCIATSQISFYLKFFLEFNLFLI